MRITQNEQLVYLILNKDYEEAKKLVAEIAKKERVFLRKNNKAKKIDPLEALKRYIKQVEPYNEIIPILYNSL